jgi:hypothetical protein
MRYKLVGLAALAIGLIVVAGCINYDQELTLNPDGSGTMMVRYDSAAQSGEETEGSISMGAAPKLSFTEDEIKAEYEGAPFTVRDIVIGKTDKDAPEATYYIDFDNISDLNGRGIFALEGDKLKQTFSLDTSGDLAVFKQLVQLKMDVEDPSSLSEYKFTYKLNAPGPIKETNGTAEGNVVTWEYTLDKLINNDVEMTASYEQGGAGGGKVALIIGIILCVIIVIVIIIVIIVLLTKKKKPAGPAATPSQPEPPKSEG